MTPIIRNGILAAVALVLALLAWSVWSERKQKPTVDQAVAAEQTKAAVVVAAKTDTAYRDRTAAAINARLPYRAARDTLLRIDTVLVDRATERGMTRAVLAKADTVILRDSIALAAAADVIAAERNVIASVRNELAIALRPRRVPRFGGSASALYDPLNAVPVASLTGSFRVIGRVSLVARGDMRFEVAGKPTGYVGVQLAW